MSNFMNIYNIQRYNDIYLEETKEEINYFDPNLFLCRIFDFLEKHKNYIYICNKEPYCDCDKECNCMNDEYEDIDIKYDILSNNKCSIDIFFKKEIKILDKNYNWCIFTLNSDSDCDEEIEIIEIKKIDSKIQFNIDDEIVKFEIDNLKKNKMNIIISFNYMSYSY